MLQATITSLLIALALLNALVFAGIPTTRDFGIYTATNSEQSSLTRYSRLLRCPASTFTLVTVSANKKLENRGATDVLYHSCFHQTDLIPQWTSHIVTRQKLSIRSKRPDVEPWGHWKPTSVAGNGRSLRPDYDRGHLSPRSDFSYDYNDAAATFNVVNRAPQAIRFNEVGWGCIECFVRQYVLKAATTDTQPFYIVTGTAWSASSPKVPETKVDAAMVRVPDFYWKVLYEPHSSRAVYFYENNTDHTRVPVARYTAPSDRVMSATFSQIGVQAWGAFSSTLEKEFTNSLSNPNDLRASCSVCMKGSPPNNRTTLA